jgi:hypothetical protein
MQHLFKYQKPICLIVLVSLCWLYMPQPPAQAAMVTTEDSIDQYSKADFDRARITAFVSRNDFIAQLQSYGISSEEALARINSLTDQEIFLIAAKLDQLPAGGVLTPDQLSLYFLIGVAIISVILAIIFYDDKKVDPVEGVINLLRFL